MGLVAIYKAYKQKAANNYCWQLFAGYSCSAYLYFAL
jgi:hypothetical protein